MSEIWHILADADEDGISGLIRLAVLIIGVAIAIIAKGMHAAAQRKQKAEEKERWDEIRKERERSQGQQDAQAQQALQQRDERLEAQRQPGPPDRAAPSGQAPPPSQAEQLGRAMRRAMGIPEPPPAPPRPAPPRQAGGQATVLKPAHPGAGRPRLRRRGPQLSEAGQASGLKTPLSQPKMGKLASQAQPPRGEPGPAAPPVPPVLLQLGNVEDAQRAIVFHEIFSAPKAIRQGGEMWDL